MRRGKKEEKSVKKVKKTKEKQKKEYERKRRKRKGTLENGSLEKQPSNKGHLVHSFTE